MQTRDRRRPVADHAAETLGDRCEVRLADAVELPFNPMSFDAILWSSVLHEVFSYPGHNRQRVHGVLREFHRVLRPEGRLAIRDGVAPAAGTRSGSA